MESLEKTRAIINQIEKNLLTTDNELQIFKAIFDKYQFKTISEYAKDHNKTYQGVEYQIKNGLVQNIKVGSIVLLFE